MCIACTPHVYIVGILYSSSFFLPPGDLRVTTGQDLARPPTTSMMIETDTEVEKGTSVMMTDDTGETVRRMADTGSSVMRNTVDTNVINIAKLSLILCIDASNIFFEYFVPKIILCFDQRTTISPHDVKFASR